MRAGRRRVDRAGAVDPLRCMIGARGRISASAGQSVDSATSWVVSWGDAFGMLDDGVDGGVMGKRAGDRIGTGGMAVSGCGTWRCGDGGCVCGDAGVAGDVSTCVSASVSGCAIWSGVTMISKLTVVGGAREVSVSTLLASKISIFYCRRLDQACISVLQKFVVDFDLS
jgi:hypothetical protein